MRYYKNPENNEVFGYDETYERDIPYIESAIANGWRDVTASWPPSPTPTPAPDIPEITNVTMRQCRLALLQENQLDDVEALITTREQLIWWDYSTQVEKYNPMTQEIATALNWTQEFLTHLFELASTL